MASLAISAVPDISVVCPPRVAIAATMRRKLTAPVRGL